MDHHLRALILHSFIQKINCTIIFFHPDCTVGPGISPDHASRLAGFTAGRESHPAPKNCNYMQYTPASVQRQPVFAEFLLFCNDSAMGQTKTAECPDNQGIPL